MAKIKINDLSKDMSISHEDMRKVHGGSIQSWADDALTSLVSGFIGATSSAMTAATSSGQSSSGRKPIITKMETRDGG